MARLAADRVLDAKVILCDRDPEILEAWSIQFEKHPEVEIVERSILGAGTDAIVCPGNSFGFMDGGLALEMSEALGWHLQDELRELVRARYDGEILVGQAVVRPSGGAPPWIVYAPTVRTPASVAGTLNAYLAARGALLAVRDHNKAAAAGADVSRIESVALPGLCTGAGGMHPLVAARQMRHAYEKIAGLRGLGDRNLSQLARREAKLRRLPASLRQEEGEES